MTWDWHPRRSTRPVPRLAGSRCVPRPPYGSLMPGSQSRLSLLARRWASEAAVLFFPSRCFVCQGTLPRLQWLGACLRCWASVATSPHARCRRCALPLPAAADAGGPAGGCCARCASRPPPFDRTVAAVVYDAHARRFLLRAKDGLRRDLLLPLAGQLAAAVTVSGIAEGIDGVVHVPSATLARLRRGFDPAGELAKVVARSCDRPLLGRALRKRGFGGPASKGLSAAARWASARTSFEPRRAVTGATILLVDDVLTTGATAAACALALRSAGAREVRVAVWARTPSPSMRFDRSE